MFLNEPRYSALRTFAVALLFIVLAPLYWQLTELAPADAPPLAHQNTPLYQWYYPAFDYAFGRVAQGEIPLWNPQVLCGMPLHADARIGLWQPLNLLFAALPTERAMAVHAFLCLAMMGAGFALFLRALGASYGAAVFGGIAFAFCGAVSGAVSRPPTAATLAWAPIALWALTEYHTTFRLGMAVLTGLLTGLMVLGGAYALALAMGLLFLAYTVYAIVFPFGYDAPPLASRIGAMTLAAATALGLSAIQWIPSLYWADFVEEGSAFVWRMSTVLAKPALPRDLFTQFLQSGAGDVPRMCYVGIATLPFIVPAVLHREGRRAAWFFLVAAPLAWALFLFGAPIAPVAFPLETFAFPAALAMATLAGLGVDTLLAPGERYSFARLAPTTFVVFAGAIGLFLLGNGLVRGILIALTAVIIVYLVLRSRWASIATALILSLLLFADLSRSNGNAFPHPFSDAPACYGQYTSTLDFARDQALGARAIFSAPSQLTALPANIGMVANIRTVGGRDISLLREQRMWWERMTGQTGLAEPADVNALKPGSPGTALLDLMGARVLAAVPGGPLYNDRLANGGSRIRPMRTEGDGRIFLNESALPRAYWVPAVVTSGSMDETLDRLLDPAFDKKNTAVVDRHSPGLVRLGGEILALARKSEDEASAPPENTSTCAVEEESPEHVTVRVQSPDVGLLVLADTFTPGWTADVNGEARVIHRVNGMFRAVHVPAGEHVVTFRYRPAPFYVGAGITAFTLLATALAAFVTVLRRMWPRRRRPQPRVEMDL